MVMKILILTFFFEIKESKVTRGHNFTLVKKQSRLDVRKFSFSQRTVNVWNKINYQRSMYMLVVLKMTRQKKTHSKYYNILIEI